MLVWQAISDQFAHAKLPGGEQIEKKFVMPSPRPRIVERRAGRVRETVRADDGETLAVAQVVKVEEGCAAWAAQDNEATLRAQQCQLAGNCLRVARQLKDHVEEAAFVALHDRLSKFSSRSQQPIKRCALRQPL